MRRWFGAVLRCVDEATWYARVGIGRRRDWLRWRFDAYRRDRGTERWPDRWQ